MNKKHMQRILEAIENEGFDYTFQHYDDFKDIKDKEFHKLRQEFLDSRDKLAKFIGLDPESA